MARRLLLFALLWLLIGCVQDDGGTEIPNELAGREFIAGRGPAADAEVKLVPVGFIPGGTQGPDSSNHILFTGKTDASGRFAFKDVPSGQYNLIATQDGLHSFRDSIAVTGKAQDLDADTLRKPAALSGWVGLEPQDSPRGVTVQLVGTTQFANVDEDGFFRFDGLGAGDYRLRSVAIYEGYAPLYRTIQIKAGANDTLRDTLWLPFTGIPVVRGIKAEPRADGTVSLSWNKPAYRKVASYLVFRDDGRSPLPSEKPILRVNDTTTIDTIYGIARDSLRYPYHDSLAHKLQYRVAILDWTSKVGPVFGFTEVTSIPPTRSFQSGKWQMVNPQVPSFGWNGRLFAFKDSLWILSAVDSSTDSNGNAQFSLIVSPDGKQWKSRLHSESVNAMLSLPAVWKDTLWAIGPGPGTRYDSLPTALWQSVDGSNWTEVAGNLPMQWSAGMQFRVIRDSLWIIGNKSYELRKMIRSGDGRSWTEWEVPIEIQESWTEIVGLKDDIFALGVLKSESKYSAPSFHSTRNGSDWEVRPSPYGLLPRSEHSAAELDGRIWIVGGSYYGYQSEYFHDVWRTEDGTRWEMVDGNAPFKGRTNPSITAFKGRICVFGGTTQTGFAWDLWCMDQ